MVFVPLARAAATDLRATGDTSGEQTGFAATPALFRHVGFDPSMDEDANFEAQTFAMVAGLLAAHWPDGNRLVLAADVPDRLLRPGPDELADFGAVLVENFSWSQVTAVFSDGVEPGPGVESAARSAAGASSGSTLAAAVELVEVEQLISEHDLLWHVPDEPW